MLKRTVGCVLVFFVCIVSMSLLCPLTCYGEATATPTPEATATPTLGVVEAVGLLDWNQFSSCMEDIEFGLDPCLEGHSRLSAPMHLLPQLFGDLNKWVRVWGRMRQGVTCLFLDIESYTVIPPPCTECDVNGDDVVDFSEVSAFSAAWGTSLGDPTYNSKFDGNYDDKIDFSDLSYFSSCYGQSW